MLEGGREREGKMKRKREGKTKQKKKRGEMGKDWAPLSKTILPKRVGGKVAVPLEELQISLPTAQNSGLGELPYIS